MATLWCDNSTLCAAEGCQTAGVLRYHLGWTGAEEVAALKAGTAVHEALAVYLRQGDALQALVVLEAEYREWADRLPPTDRLAYPNVAAILRRWFATHPLASFPFVVPAGMVEVGAQALLTPEGECLCGHGELDGHTSGGSACSLCPCPEATSVVFVGRLDAAVRSRDGRWWALDHKTTGRISPEWLAAFELDSQMSGYIWLLQQHLREPVAGAYINAIELSRLPSDPTRKCRPHGVVYAECGPLHCEATLVQTTRTPAQLAAWRADALRAARRWRELLVAAPTLDRITAVGQRGQWLGRCPRCEFRPFCKLDRDVSMIPVLYTHSPWRPYERVGPATPKGGPLCPTP